MGLHKKGKTLSPEHRAKCSKALKGRILTPITEEIREKMRLAWVRRRLIPVPDEVRRKISTSNKGKIFSEETKEKIRLSKLGKKRNWSPSEAQREAVSKANLGRKMKPEDLEKRQASRLRNKQLRNTSTKENNNALSEISS